MAEAGDSMLDFAMHVQNLLDIFAAGENIDDCFQFLAKLPTMSAGTSRLGPRASLQRLENGLKSVRDSAMSSAEAVCTTIPYWECHSYPVCVLCEALSRCWGIPAVFYLGNFRAAFMSLMHKEAHVRTSGYKAKHRPWSCNVGDAGTGKSHPADQFADLVDEACKLENSFAIGHADDNFHVLKTRTYAALEDKMRDTNGYAQSDC